jgi:hypothetical protein
VLALDANALRVLTRLGYGDSRRSYSASYRQAQSGASAELPASGPASRLLIFAGQQEGRLGSLRYRGQDGSHTARGV